MRVTVDVWPTFEEVHDNLGIFCPVLSVNADMCLLLGGTWLRSSHLGAPLNPVKRKLGHAALAYIVLQVELLEHAHLLCSVFAVQLIVPGRSVVDGQHQLAFLEFHDAALLVDYLEEGLLAQRLEERVQVQLGQGHFQVPIAAVLPHLIERGSVDQGVVGVLRVDHWPDEWLVRVALVELGREDYVPGFGDLLDREVGWSVEFVLSHHDLAVEDDDDLVVWRDNDQIIFLLLYDLNLVNVSAEDLVVWDALHEGEDLKVLAEVLESLCRFEIRLWLGEPHQVCGNTLVVKVLIIVHID